MSTLLLRLAGPLQSWGLNAKFDRRGTERVPTKSGVIGLIAAAMGRRRDDAIDDLSALRFGVRVETEGKLLEDFHIARSVKSAYVTRRFYLSDAVFLAGLEGDEVLLREIEASLRSPAFPLFLRRRCCPPEGKLLVGLRSGKSLSQALMEEEWQGSLAWKRKEARQLRLYLEAQDGEAGYLMRDEPLSFRQSFRQFGFRRVSSRSQGMGQQNGIEDRPTKHDAMRELED